MEIEARIRQFILQNLYFSQDNSLTDEASFLETGVVDSMGVMELVAFVESEYGLQVAPQEIVVENFDSIAKLGAFVRKKVPVNGAKSVTAPRPELTAVRPSSRRPAGQPAAEPLPAASSRPWG